MFAKRVNVPDEAGNNDFRNVLGVFGRGWYLKLVTTNLAFSTIASLIKTKLHILNEHCGEHCNTMNVLKEFSTKRTRQSRQQRLSKRIRSFRSWLEPEICDHQLCISNHDFSNNNSIANLKQALCRTLQYKECVFIEFETKRTR